MSILTNRTILLISVINILSCTVCYAANSTSSADRLSLSIPIAFVDVNLVSMNRDEIIEHQTVLVERDQIVAIGPTAAVRVPPGVRRIAGVGRYLMPGLIDMHVHFRRKPTDDDTAYSRMPDYRERNDDTGVLFVANGVTSVRMMHRHPVGDELTARSRGDWLGPTIYSTGPITDGSPPVHPFNRVLSQPAGAGKLVAEDKAKGYIGIKVYENLSLPVYDAIADAAHSNLKEIPCVPLTLLRFRPGIQFRRDVDSRACLGEERRRRGHRGGSQRLREGGRTVRIQSSEFHARAGRPVD